MGCLTVNITKVGGGIDTNLDATTPINVHWGLPEEMSVQAQLQELCDVEFSCIHKPFSANFGLVCSVGQGAWEFLMCSDKGFVRTYDKGYILVRKR